MTMKKLISVISIAAISAISICAAPAHSETNQNNKNYIGPQVSLSGGATGFGVNGKIGVADNISVRPFASIYSFSIPGNNLNITFVGASATYDFNLSQAGQPPSAFAPYAGIGYEAILASGQIGNNVARGAGSGLYGEIGTDYHFNESFLLNANYRIQGLGGLSVGGAYKF
jgi:acetyltransferase-like isoleucine patch superfamily enzyme